MQAGNILIPANSIITGACRIGGERMEVTIGSIQYAGNIIPVELQVYDLDGQRGISVPNSDEIRAAKEIAAQMAQSAGSSITITDDAVSQFTAEGGYYLKILSDPSKTFLLSLGGSALAGYETSNWGEKILYDGSTLRHKDAFVYGGAITLELETYLSDRVVLLMTGRQRVLWGNSTGHFHTQFGIGLKFIIN